MAINNDFNSTNEIINFLNTLNKTSWKEEEITPEGIQQFISRHLTMIANTQNKTLQDTLLTLSNRINQEWDDPETNKLAFEIMGIANGVFNKSEGPIPSLPEEMWGEVLSHIPPRDPEIRSQSGGIPSGLENAHPSKQISDIAGNIETKWASEELVSLRKYGCRTAAEAVDYAIKHQLSGVNLSEFTELRDLDLVKLFENCPNIEQLSIYSDRITTLPAKASSLKTLFCSYCHNLERLPELPEIQVLDCSYCKKLKGLQEMPKLQQLDCTWCEALHGVPELPAVKVLNCYMCYQLTSLGKLPNVQILNCTGCRLETLPDLLSVQKLQCSMHCLKILPDLPNVLELDCNECELLRKLPELPKVLKLDCSGCKFQNLPELPEVQILDCSFCKNFQSLPAMKNVLKADCSGCKNLQTLSEMPKVKKLTCKKCPNLQNLPNELPEIEKIDYRKCPRLQNLPAFPAGVKVKN